MSLTSISTSWIVPQLVTPPAVVWTPALLRGLVLQILAVSHSVTHQPGLGEAQEAGAGGAPGWLV